MNTLIEIKPHLRIKALIIFDQVCNLEKWSLFIDELGVDIYFTKIAEELTEIWGEYLPDLIILENYKIGIEVIDICHTLRNLTQVPILLMTPNKEEGFCTSAYQAGIDECIIQPISLDLFLAKLRAWLRHTRQLPLNSLETLQVSDLILDPTTRIFRKQSTNPIKLSILETRLMYILMTFPNRPIEINDLTQRVWGVYGYGTKEMLKNIIYRTRLKIEENPNKPEIIVSTGRYGYMLVA